MHDPGPIPQAPRKRSPWLRFGLGCGLLSLLTTVAVIAALVLVVTGDDRGGTFDVGDRFEVENVHYTVSAVHTGVPRLGDALQNARPDEHGAFVLVVLRVTNERRSELAVDTSDFLLYEGGTAYEPSTEAGAAILVDNDFGFDDGTEYGTVNAREVRDMPLLYDAPDTDLTHMTVTPGADPDLRVIVDLSP
ncbi:uncharacterized protein DUF4352 [Nocardiopsis sp. Huas11]|uniref:DUF4352 domain-containing protein n=1 Tax=Nocardiopsis sp. Huas11 TaxID=2183912 RepID=UPI000EB424C0|nr:DUF4352 domain-containing protein [Nocardiopsis sp. Huas11]RKS07589.1 uncharacterized protein DUF4352 [Nocardiopsis sp. Huas11]